MSVKLTDAQVAILRRLDDGESHPWPDFEPDMVAWNHLNDDRLIRIGDQLSHDRITPAGRAALAEIDKGAGK